MGGILLQRKGALVNWAHYNACLLLFILCLRSAFVILFLRSSLERDASPDLSVSLPNRGPSRPINLSLLCSLSLHSSPLSPSSSSLFPVSLSFELRLPSERLQVCSPLDLKLAPSPERCLPNAFSTNFLEVLLILDSRPIPPCR